MLDAPGEDTGLSVGADFLLREDKGLTVGGLLDGVHEALFVLAAERGQCGLGTRRHSLEVSSERRSCPLSALFFLGSSSAPKAPRYCYAFRPPRTASQHPRPIRHRHGVASIARSLAMKGGTLATPTGIEPVLPT